MTFSNQHFLVKEPIMLLTSMEHWPKKAGNSMTTSVCSRFSQAWHLGPAHYLLPGISDSKESTCNAGDLGSIPGLRRSPGGGYGNPLQYSCLENRHGRRSLVGYRPWGHKESDVPEGLSAAQFVAGGSSVHCRKFSSSPGLYLLDASSTTPSHNN